MWEALAILPIFSLSLALLLWQFTKLLSQAADQQAKVLISMLEPVLNPPTVFQPPETEQPEQKLPAWLDGAQSVDLLETGRMTDWDVPEIADEDSIGPPM